MIQYVRKQAWLFTQHYFLQNEEVTAASYWHQAAALVSDIFYNFYVVKNHKIAYNSATTEAIKNKHIFGTSFEF
jgi:hypothetical protein